jgi:cytochrome b
MMSNEIRVWDPLVRIFHWGLVLSFTIAYLSGDEESSLHIYSGYVVLGGHNPAGGAMVIAMLLCLIVVSVSGLKVYAIEEGLGPLASEPPALTVISSAYADDDGDENDNHEKNENGHGEDEEAEEFWEEIHEVSSNVMLLLIFLHIVGVIVSGRLHDEHLVKAMLTGKKISKTDA